MSAGPSRPKSILKSRSDPTTLDVRHGPSASLKSHRPAKGSKLRHSVPVKQSRRKADAKEEKDEEESEDAADDDVSMEEGDGVHEEGDEPGTNGEIQGGRAATKGKKPLKRKRPPTDATTFGSTLTSLLAAPARPDKTKKIKSESSSAPSKPFTEPLTPTTAESKPLRSAPANLSAQQTILSLSSRLPPSAQALALERKAAREVKRVKEERDDRARVKDVAEGWGPAPAAGLEGGQDTKGQTEKGRERGSAVLGGAELEKVLRKTAQRGGQSFITTTGQQDPNRGAHADPRAVIKLFNAILQASRASEAGGTPVPSEQHGLKHLNKLDQGSGGKKSKADNIMSRGGKKALTKEGFLDLVRKG